MIFYALIQSTWFVFLYINTCIVSLSNEHYKAGLAMIYQYNFTIFKHIISTAQIFTTFIVLPRVSTTIKEVSNIKECVSHVQAAQFRTSEIAFY